MGKRVFEHADEGKFWEIWVEGPKIYTRHGKLGANGQTKVKDGDRATVDSMVEAKLADGFVQTDGAVAGPALDQRELARHLRGLVPLADDPAYLVLADWLQTQNHPWGELIVLQHRAATDPGLAAQAAKHLADHAPVLLGELAGSKHSHFDWHHGFVRRAVIGAPASVPADAKALIAAVEDFLALPVAHMVETIVFAPYRETFRTLRDWGQSEQNLVDPWEDLVKIAAAIPARITRVGLGGWPASAAAGYVEMPSFTEISAAFPKLTALELTGYLGDNPGELSLPELTSLAVRLANGNGAAMRALVMSKLPKLERLEVWLGGTSNCCVDDVYGPEDYDSDNEDALRYPATYSASDLEMMSPYNSGIDLEVTANDLTTLLSARFSPELVHLSIGAPRWTPELMSALAGSAMVKRVKTLTISGGNLDEAQVDPLVQSRSIAALETIEVRSVMTVPTVRRLETVSKINAVVIGEREDFHFRYVATVE